MEPEPVERLQFARSGDLLIVTKAGGVRLWPRGKKPRLVGATSGEHPIAALSADSRFLATVSGSGKDVLVTRLSDNSKPTTVAFGRPFTALALSDDGALLACGTEDGDVLVRTAQNGSARCAFHAHVGSVQTLRFAPHGTEVACGGEDHPWHLHTLELRNARTGRLDALLDVGSNSHAFCFSGGGDTIAVEQTDPESLDPEIVLWDWRRERKLRSVPLSQVQATGHLRISPDGRAFAPIGSAASGEGARIWKSTVVTEAASTPHAALSEDGALLALAPAEDRIAVYRMQDGACVRWWPPGPRPAPLPCSPGEGLDPAGKSATERLVSFVELLFQNRRAPGRAARKVAGKRLRELLAEGADPRVVAKFRLTPLMAAASWGDPRLVELMLVRGAPVNARADYGETALLCAVKADRVDLVRLLLARGATLTLQSGYRLEGVTHPPEELTAELKRLLDAKEPYALHGCLLVMLGADPAVRGRGGRCLLHCVADPHLLSHLIRLGAPVDQADDEGATALMRQVGLGGVPALRVLLEAGAQVDQRDGTGATALFWAVGTGRVDAFHLLLQRGAAVAIVDRSGRSPLMAALENGDLLVARELGAAGTPVDIASRDGMTPLQIAVRQQDTEAALWIVRRAHNLPFLWSQLPELDRFEQVYDPRQEFAVMAAVRSELLSREKAVQSPP